MTNRPKVRIGSESADLDFLLDQVANGDLSLAYCFTAANSPVGNLLRAAIDSIQAARVILRDHVTSSIDFDEVKLANR